LQLCQQTLLHPWSKDTSWFNPKEGEEAFTADFRLCFTEIGYIFGSLQGSTQRKTPSNNAPPDVDYYAAISTSHLMPNVVDLSDEISGIMSHAAMMSKHAKVNAKLSADDPDPISIDACKKSNY